MGEIPERGKSSRKWDHSRVTSSRHQAYLIAAETPGVGVVPVAADVVVVVDVAVDVSVAVVVGTVAGGRTGGLIPDGPDTTWTV